MLTQGRHFLHTHLNTPIRRALAVVVFLALLLLAILWLVLSWGTELDARHQPLDFAEVFDYENGSYTDYLAWAERRLRAAHPDVGDEVIANLAPFRLEPAADCPISANAAYRNGVVLTHDLLDSPYAMRALGAYFQERCFLVYGLQLPGHGTRPGDLRSTGWEDWAAAERFAVRALAGETENQYLSGYGVGGSLALLEASGNAAIDGLVLFAPALDTRPTSWRAVAGTLFGWLAPAARWAEVVPPYSIYRYDSITYGIASETNDLVRTLATTLSNQAVELPTFTVVSMDDATVSAQAVLDYMAGAVHPMSFTVVYSRSPLDEQPGRKIVISQIADADLVSMSHRSLAMPQEDPEFGWSGASRDCGHYYRVDQALYARCLASEFPGKGEITPELLAAGPLERVESNLLFYELLRDLDTFIAPVAPVPDIRTK